MKLSTVPCFVLLHMAKVKGFLEVHIMDSLELEDATHVGLLSGGAANLQGAGFLCSPNQQATVQSSFIKQVQEKAGIHFLTAF